MIAWYLEVGGRTGRFNAEAIERELSQTHIDPSGSVTDLAKMSQ